MLRLLLYWILSFEHCFLLFLFFDQSLWSDEITVQGCDTAMKCQFHRGNQIWTIYLLNTSFQVMAVLNVY